MFNFFKKLFKKALTKMDDKLVIKTRYIKYYGKKRTKSVYGIIVHYISAVNIKPNDPYNLNEIIKIFNTYKVSADYLVDREGIVYRLIPEGSYSYHAGVSQMSDGTHSTTSSGKSTLNDITVGIEMMATNKSGYTDAQYKALILLTKQLKKKYKITDNSRIEGHEDVCIPKGRKKDPGKLFGWKRYKDGIK